MRKAVIIVPTYNESGNIKELVEQIFEQARKIANWRIDVLIVDSSSPDGTGNIVKSLKKHYPQLHLLSTKKLGLGTAYIEGFQYSLNNLTPYLVFEMDADWSHDPKNIVDFLDKIEKGADFVIGSRYIRGGSIPRDWEFHRKIFSFFGNLIIRFGFMKPTVTDWTSGYRAIKTWVVKSLLNKVKNYSGYVFQIAVIDQALKNKADIKEVPINFKDRKSGVSKINFSQYIFQILIYIFYNSSFVKYVIVGFIGFFIDFGLSYLMIEKFHIKKDRFWLVTSISAETAIIGNFCLNNFWSFSYKKLENKINVFILNFLKFNLVALGALIIQAVGIQVLTNLIGAKFWYVYKVLIIGFIIIPYSYILYNKVVWKDK